MTQRNRTINLTELLLECIGKPDPMLNMLEWLCDQLMEAEISGQLGAAKNEHSEVREGYRSGYRPRRLDTRMGTMYLLVPKARNGGYIPFFITERKRSEAALVEVVQEAFVQGVSTRKIEKLAKRLGIENLSRSQVSEMTKGLNEQVEAFRNRPLSDTSYPVLWVDALYEKVRFNGRVVSMAILLVCAVNSEGKREVLSIEPMLEESAESYIHLFTQLKKPRLGNTGTGCFRCTCRTGQRDPAKLSRSIPGNDAKCISCGISLPMYHTVKRTLLPNSSRKSGWRQPMHWPDREPRRWRKPTRSVSQKRSIRWITGWKIHSPSTVFRRWMPARSPQPICWNA